MNSKALIIFYLFLAYVYSHSRSAQNTAELHLSNPSDENDTSLLHLELRTDDKDRPVMSAEAVTNDVNIKGAPFSSISRQKQRIDYKERPRMSAKSNDMNKHEQGLNYYWSPYFNNVVSSMISFVIFNRYVSQSFVHFHQLKSGNAPIPVNFPIFSKCWVLNRASL